MLAHRLCARVNHNRGVSPGYGFAGRSGGWQRQRERAAHPDTVGTPPGEQASVTSPGERFRDLHSRDAGHALVLPNAWDAVSARLIEEDGAKAIATTSAGIAWALGYPDGQRIRREEMLWQVALIVRTVRVPVTADVESGYGDGTAADAADTARGGIGAGAVGLNPAR